MVNNLVLRIISAILLAPLVIYVLYLGGTYFQILALTCLFLMLYEWFDINNKNKRMLVIGGIVAVIEFTVIKMSPINIAFFNLRYVIYTMLLSLAYCILRRTKIITVALLALMVYLIIHMLIIPKPYGAPVNELIYFCGSIVVALITGHLVRKTSKENTLFSGGVFYILIPMLYVICKVTEASEDFFKMALWVLIVVWSCDMFAYFGGRMFGGAKLAPRISPNKTWSGAIVGAIMTLFITYFGIAQFVKIDKISLTCVTFAMIIASIMGDLLESKCKRILNVKDSGNIIPGHGGILDRLDSLLMVIYVFVIAETLWYLKLDLKMLLTSTKWI